MVVAVVGVIWRLSLESSRFLAEEEVPIPPLKLMRSVGPVDAQFYRNPFRVNVFNYERAAIDYSAVFDFGCGCGRIARQMLFQDPPPRSYTGVDLNSAAIDWCRSNLSPWHDGFVFYHLDIFNRGLNPDGSEEPAFFIAEDASSSFVLAHSVFTHIIESHVKHYVQECARVLDPSKGLFRSTWFLFDKKYLPMMQEYQNAIYINVEDPTNAVIYDLHYMRELFRGAGLTIVQIIPPEVRGYQWVIYASKAADAVEAAFPEDAAPFGRIPPPD